MPQKSRKASEIRERIYSSVRVSSRWRPSLWKPFVLSETLRLCFVKYFESKAFNNLDTHFFYLSASRRNKPDTSAPVSTGPLQCCCSKRWMSLSCLLRRSHHRTHATLFGRMIDKTETNSSTHGYTDSGPALVLSCTEPVFFFVCLCPPSERSCAVHPSGRHPTSLQHQDPAGSGHRVRLRLHPDPTGRKCAERDVAWRCELEMWVAVEKASKLTVAISSSRLILLPASQS